MGIRLVIADKEAGYINGFVKYLEVKSEREYERASYDDKEKLKEYLDNNRCDILLIGESMYEEDFNYSNVNIPIYLYEDEEPQDVYSISNKIYKYQRVSEVLAYINEKIATVKEEGYRMNSEARDTSVYAVYSPTGGSGKTTTAVALAMQLAKQNKHVMYLNLERFCGTELYFPYESRSSLSQVFEQLNEKPSKQSRLEYVASIDDTSQISYFSRFESLEEYEDLTPQSMDKLLTSIVEEQVYDVLIVDRGSELDEMQCSVLDKSDKIILIEQANEIDNHKMNLLGKKMGREWQEKLMVVQNKVYPVDQLAVEGVVGIIPEIGIQEARRLSQYIANKGYIKI